MKKRNIVLGIAAVLSMALVLSACENEEEEIEYGLLTIKNAPVLGTYDFYGEQRKEEWGGGVYFDEDITTQLGLHNWTVGGYNMVAYFDNDVPPFKLADSKEVLKGFLKSGSYSVYLYRATAIRGDTYFLSGVTFKNGKATIDFNDMTLEASLPYN